MGIICDKNGNIYVGCAGGVEIWDAGGSILGVVEVPGGLMNTPAERCDPSLLIIAVGGVASLSWGREGELFLCAEQQLWRMEVGEQV